MDRTVTDQELLDRYAQGADQEAFRALVARHVNLVFASARRQMENAEAAEDVVQAVFVVLARCASNIRATHSLAPWLLKVTRLCAADARRQEARRHKHEQKAATMHKPAAAEDAIGSEVVSRHLDAGLGKLRNADRLVLIEHYLQGHSMAAVGQTLGIAEEAAKKRVARALQRLRKVFGRRGTMLSVAMISAALASQIRTAPAAFLDSAFNAALGNQKTRVSAMAQRVMGRMSGMMTFSVVGASLLLASLVGILAAFNYSSRHSSPLPPISRVAATTLPAPNAGDGLMSMPELIAALEARRGRIRSIEWSVTYDIDVADGRPPGVTQTSRYGRLGSEEYFTQSSPGSPDETIVSDGKAVREFTPIHQADIPLSGTGSVWPLAGTGMTVFPRNLENPSGFTGEYIWNYDLLTNLKQGHVTLAPRWVEENGAKCYELQGEGIPREVMAPGFSVEQLARLVPPRFRLLLDPARNLMPRRIEQFVDDKNANVFDRFEFREMSPGEWFPTAARQQAFQRDSTGAPSGLVRTYQIHATVESLNQKIPASRFMLEFPAGTRVIDYTDAALEGGVVHQFVVGDTTQNMDFRKLSNGRLEPILPQRGRGR